MFTIRVVHNEISGKRTEGHIAARERGLAACAVSLATTVGDRDPYCARHAFFRGATARITQEYIGLTVGIVCDHTGIVANESHITSIVGDRRVTRGHG